MKVWYPNDLSWRPLQVSLYVVRCDDGTSLESTKQSWSSISTISMTSSSQPSFRERGP